MKRLTLKRAPRDQETAAVKPVYKSKRTLRDDLDRAHRRYEGLHLNHQDTLRQLDDAQAKYEDARENCWNWDESYHILTEQLSEAEKARDQAIALAAEYAAILEQKYGWAPPNDPEWADTDDVQQPDAATETPAWNDTTRMVGVVDLDAEPESFTTYIKRLHSNELGDEEIQAALKKPRRRVPAARKPSGQS